MAAKPSDMTYDLLAKGQTDEALRLIEPLATLPQAAHGDMAAYAYVLKAMNRREDARAVYEQAVKRFPTSAVAEHNLAGIQGDLGDWEAAEAGCRRAFEKGGDAGETWQILGRAQVALGRNAEAMTSFREAVKRCPTNSEVHRDLAQLIWMTSGDKNAAAEALRAAVLAAPGDHSLVVQLSKALQFGGEEDAALVELRRAISRAPDIVYELESAASILAALVGDSQGALHHATQAMTARPGDAVAAVLACDAYLGLGRPDYVAQLATRVHQKQPDDQSVLARLGTALRMLGDDNYPVLYDYEAFVRPAMIDTPEGWPSLEAYLADLGPALRRMHTFETHPFDQSLRGGSQTSQDLEASDEPAVRAFFSAIDGPIRRYMEAVGQGRDPLRRRNVGTYKVAGAWSVMLRPNGFHVNHVHPQGWLSSACYIELPSVVADESRREGWIKFGEPGIPTRPPLEPEHFVRPQPGMLVLFPSYMWHGTVPFTGDENRITIAFDVAPA